MVRDWKRRKRLPAVAVVRIRFGDDHTLSPTLSKGPKNRSEAEEESELGRKGQSYEEFSWIKSWSVGEDVGHWAHQGAEALDANVHFIPTQQGLQTANATIVVSTRKGRV